MSMNLNEKIISRMAKVCNESIDSRLLISPFIPRDLHSKKSDQKRAAVLVPLCHRYGEPSILFNVRSFNVGTHKGQVSFPGGHIEENESEIDAAIRETKEELGENIGNIKIIGTCQTIPAITGTLVTPIIGFIDRDIKDFEHFEPNKDEIDSIFSRSIEVLNQNGFKNYHYLKRDGKEIKMPYFGDEGKERIWGLTAMILQGVLDNVINPVLNDV